MIEIPGSRLSNDSAFFNPNSYVTQTAELLGLAIPPQQMASVVKNFEQIQAIAQPVLDFPLPDTLEVAPSFEP
jgi:hypothetical protein